MHFILFIYLFIFNLSTMVFLYSVIYFILHNHTILVSVFTEMKTFKHYVRDHTTSIFLILQICTKQEGGREVCIPLCGHYFSKRMKLGSLLI